MKKLYPIALVALLVGCTQKPQTLVNESVDALGNKVIEQVNIDKFGNREIVTETTTHVDLKKFVSTNLPEGKGSLTAYNAPLGLNNIVDIPAFTGDVEDLVYLITAHTGYKYVPYSGIKISPVRVTYETHGKTALEAFTEVNNLIGVNAVIKISEVAKTVQVIYPLSALTFE